MNLQSEIAALQGQLTSNHPTIKRAQASLAALQKSRQEFEQQGLERQAAALTIQVPPNQACAIPLLKVGPDVAFKSNMPLIASDSNVQYAMRQVTLPAPSCDEQAKK